MKSTSLLYLSLIFLLLLSCETKTIDQTTIKGKVSSDEPYLLFSKLESVSQKKYSLVDSIFIDEKGKFNYEFQNEPGIYQLKSVDGKKVDLAINLKEQISVSKNKKGFKVSGSVDTEKLEKYEAFRRKSLNRLVLSVRRDIKKMTEKGASETEITAKRAEEVSNYAIHLDELAEYTFDQLKKSLALVPTSLRWNAENLSMYESLTYDFREKYGEINATTQLQNKIALLQKTRIGGQFPEVSMSSKEGNIITLNPSNSELTLIDFWGSWCPPCRVESPLLNELYENYDRADFNIYGISLDFKRDKWEAALEKDHRIWDNVSELKGLATPIAAELGITALPFNFLIDQQGKIVASNIHGEELKEFISEYLKTSKSL